MVSPVIVETDDGRSLEGECINISMGGMCLSLKGEIKHTIPGTVTVMFEEDGNTVEFIARFSIAWARAERPEIPVYNAGIQFAELDDENRGRLTRIILTCLMKLEQDRKEGKPVSVQER